MRDSTSLRFWSSIDPNVTGPIYSPSGSLTSLEPAGAPSEPDTGLVGADSRLWSEGNVLARARLSSVSLPEDEVKIAVLRCVSVSVQPFNCSPTYKRVRVLSSNSKMTPPFPDEPKTPSSDMPSSDTAAIASIGGGATSSITTGASGRRAAEKKWPQNKIFRRRSWPIRRRLVHARLR